MNPSTSVPANAPFNAFLGAVETQILNPVIVLLTFAAFVIFVWGVVEYIRNADNDEMRKLGQSHILWGIIGLCIIFGVYGIIAVLNAVVTQVL